MSNPKKQHFVPQSYLKHFTNSDGFLHIYDLVSDQFRVQTPGSTGYSNNFYTVEIDGNKDYSIEKMLAVNVDSLYNPIVSKIANREVLTHEDKINLATFLTFQHLRTPAQRKNYDKMVETFYKKSSKIIFQMKKVHNQLEHYSSEDLESLEDILENEKFQVNVPKEQSLGFMLKFSEEMIQMLTNHNFVIIEASNKSEFITSDNPYCMVKEKWTAPYEGYGIINTTKIFPITPKHLLVLKDPGDKMFYMKMSKAQVRSFNFIIFDWADRLLFSRNKLLIQSLVKTYKKSKQLNQKDIQ